jgi:RNA polymerase sigma-70 factor (ECF subfamily)
MRALELVPSEEGLEAAAGGSRRSGEGPASSRPAQGADELVRRAKKGDVAAFEALYRSHVGRVYAICLRMHGDAERAEDATQEAFLRAWRRISGFEGRSAFSTWLHRLAVNVVLDQIRAAKRRGIEVGAGEEGEESIRLVEARAGPPELSIDLERAIARLPPGARTAFVLHDIEGYKHREIAEMTGTAEGTWKAQLHRARRLLREALGE